MVFGFFSLLYCQSFLCKWRVYKASVDISTPPAISTTVLPLPMLFWSKVKAKGTQTHCQSYLKCFFLSLSIPFFKYVSNAFFLISNLEALRWRMANSIFLHFHSQSLCLLSASLFCDRQIGNSYFLVVLPPRSLHIYELCGRKISFKMFVTESILILTFVNILRD